MPSKMKKNQFQSLTEKERIQLRQMIEAASEPIAPFWPMRTMVAQNPIHGLEYLPFDQAVKKGKELLGGNGYLPNDEYQQFYRDGRITKESLRWAFQKVGPRQTNPSSIRIGSRQITASDVWQLHMLVGFEELPPALLEWELGDNGSTTRFHQNLSEASRQRIIEQTIQECEQCRNYPEKAYLANLWKSMLAVLELSESRSLSQSFDRSVLPATGSIFLPTRRTISDWVDCLANAGLVDQINDQLIKWVAAFLDEGLAGWEMPQRQNGFYQTWRQLVQSDYSGSLLGIKDFSQKISDLPEDSEGAIVSCLQHLGIPQDQWSNYLSRQLSLLPGWTRYIRWLGEHPAYHAQQKHPIDTTQYLAVRLFYEVELTNIYCQQEWGIDGTLSALTTYWNDRSDEYHNRIGEGWHSVDQTKQMICRDAWRLFHLAQFLELSPIAIHDLSLEMLIRCCGGWINFRLINIVPYGLKPMKSLFEQTLSRRLQSIEEPFQP